MYELQGIICSPTVARAADLPCHQLTDSLVLVPFNKALLERTGIAVLAVSYRESEAQLESFLASVSAHGTALYVEAEFWGGRGGQISWLWQDGKPVGLPEKATFAINAGLAQLGVQPKGDGDQFDVIGLGEYRRVDEWPTSFSAAGGSGG